MGLAVDDDELMTSRSRKVEDAEKNIAVASRHHQNALERMVSDIDQADADDRYQLEADDNRPRKPAPDSVSSSINSNSNHHHNQKQVISWKQNDPENPYNWAEGRKYIVVGAGITTVLNSTMGSSLPSNAISYIVTDFGVTSEAQQVLPISMFVAGYVLGPLLFGPLSEQYGRKIVTQGTFFCFTVFTMACALAPNWPALIVFRLLSGIFASSALVVSPGTYADIYSDPVSRGRAMALFMSATCFGPLIAPIISGFISPVKGWRWTFWIGLMIAGISWIPLLLCPETFGPVLLAKKARHLRRTTSNPQIFAPADLDKKGFKQMATVTLTRPIRMLFFELIVAASSAYLSLIYAVFYMFFEAFPIIFEGIYGMSPGVAGLMFLPISAGAATAIVVFLLYDNFLQRAKAQGKKWTQKEESRRLPLAYIGGPLLAISMFWLGWSARTSVPWVVPFLAGFPFGLGFVLMFMALLNYLTDAYEIFAASAMAAASCCRSFAGTVLPFAAKPMYRTLGVAWASSLLGFLSLAMCVIPYVFVAYGDTIRRKSLFCTYLKEKKEKERLEAEAEAAAQAEREARTMKKEEL